MKVEQPTVHLLTAVLAGARDGFAVDLTDEERERLGTLLLTIENHLSDSTAEVFALGSADARFLRILARLSLDDDTMQQAARSRYRRILAALGGAS